MQSDINSIIKSPTTGNFEPFITWVRSMDFAGLTIQQRISVASRLVQIVQIKRLYDEFQSSGLKGITHTKANTMSDVFDIEEKLLHEGFCALQQGQNIKTCKNIEIYFSQVIDTQPSSDNPKNYGKDADNRKILAEIAYRGAQRQLERGHDKQAEQQLLTQRPLLLAAPYRLINQIARKYSDTKMMIESALDSLVSDHHSPFSHNDSNLYHEGEGSSQSLVPRGYTRCSLGISNIGGYCIFFFNGMYFATRGHDYIAISDDGQNLLKNRLPNNLTSQIRRALPLSAVRFILHTLKITPLSRLYFRETPVDQLSIESETFMDLLERLPKNDL